MSDLNPKAQFVVVALPLINTESLLAVREDRAKLQTIYSEYLRSLTKLIKKYKINMVDMQPFNIQGLIKPKDYDEEQWQGLVKYLFKIKREFQEQLFKKNSKTLFFQELPDMIEAISLFELNSPISLPRKSDNLFRVGYWEKRIPITEFKNSKDLSQFLPEHQKELWFVADLFLNFTPENKGILEQDVSSGNNHMMTEYDGLSYTDIGPLRPDIATALALSYHNYLKQTAKLAQWEEALVTKVLDPNREQMFLKYHLSNNS